jgi:hypothetical protein
MVVVPLILFRLEGYAARPLALTNLLVAGSLLKRLAIV